MRPVSIIASAAFAAVASAALWAYAPDLSRRELEEKYLRAPTEMMTISAPGQAPVRLHVRDDGPRTGPALIMLHGFGSSLHTYEAWARALQDDFRVVRFDLPGSGLSPPDPSGDYTDMRSIEIILALMDTLDIARASLIGNSIGGRIGWTMAATHPAHVEKLVLISPDGFASPGFEYGDPPKASPLLEAMRFFLPRALLRANIAPGYGDPAALSDETVTRYHDLMRAPGGRGALLERMRQTVLVEPEPLLRVIQAPVLLVWGEKDALIPFSNAADYARALPDSRLASFPDLGHVPQEEAPDLSLRPVRAFLEQ